MSTDLPVLSFVDLPAWERWLKKHGDASSGIWMKLAKAGAPEPTLDKPKAIEGALCHGGHKALMYSIAAALLGNITCTCPAIRSVSAGAAPRYERCTMSMGAGISGKDRWLCHLFGS